MRKRLCAMALTAMLSACATVPPPPQCDASGNGLAPINPDQVTDAQRKAVRAARRRAQGETETAMMRGRR